jgi:WD40 repeat protein
MLGEPPGKLLSMSGLASAAARSSGLAPCQVITVPGAGSANDAAFNPDGNRLAVACRDGSVQLLDWPSGQCIAGYRVRGGRGRHGEAAGRALACHAAAELGALLPSPRALSPSPPPPHPPQSYYGAALCCCWSPDGRFVASGGEDDLVAVYSVPDKQVVAFGEGHSSFVSRVAFDPWSCSDSGGAGSGNGGGGEQGGGGAGGGNGAGITERTYRLGSAGHDTALCLWDLVIEEDPAVFHQQAGQAGIK